jgi:hypothetical protein
VRLVVFHYHLLPGGVTQVIKSSALAALVHLPEINKICLVSGKKDNTESVLKAIKTQLPDYNSEKTEIERYVIPEIGYLSEIKIYPSIQEIKNILVEHFSGSIWWIHNYHIGKNPIFTEALLQIVAEFPEQKIVMQIHDFPEASRFKNFDFLNQYVRSPLYPIYSNIRYVVINSRDYNFLVNAGIPDKMVFLLNNPIEPLRRNVDGDGEISYKKINKILSKSESSYIRNAPLLIYPVRTIRRKNVLEAGLLAKCCPVSVNILPTLPGVSKTETGYSKIVDICFDEKLIPGASKTGLTLEEKGISFEEVMNAGKIILSSSVQEGFGYLFINSLQWNKPLFARKLDIINDFGGMFSSDFSHFYQHVNIPLSNKLRNQLHEAYDRKISEIDKFLDKNIISVLKEQKSQILKDEYIDFSYLSAPMQKIFLEEIEDSGLLKETRELNNIKLEEMEKLLFLSDIPFNEIDIIQFSLPVHAETIGIIISSFKKDFQVNNTSSKSINYSIISSFADFPSISLLYDPV